MIIHTKLKVTDNFRCDYYADKRISKRQSVEKTLLFLYSFEHMDFATISFCQATVSRIQKLSKDHCVSF